MKKEIFLYKCFVLFLIFCPHVVSCATKPLHIFFVVGRFPSPSQIFVLNMITGLIDRGHKVSIFSFHKDPRINMHSNIKKYNLLKHVIYKKFPDKLPKCDIVFCQFGHLAQKIFEMPHLSDWLKHKQVVVCLRGVDITSHLQEDPHRYKRILKQAKLFLPVCDYFKQKLIALGCKKSKIVVHHSAIDCSQFSFTPRSKPKNNQINCKEVSSSSLFYCW